MYNLIFAAHGKPIFFKLSLVLLGWDKIGPLQPSAEMQVFKL